MLSTPVFCFGLIVSFMTALPFAPLRAQPADSVTVWALTYRFFADSRPQSDPDLFAPAGLRKQLDISSPHGGDLPALRIWVNDTLLRVESRGFISTEFYLVDKTDSTQISWDSTSRQARKTQTGMPDVLLLRDSVLVIDPGDIRFGQAARSDTVLGYKTRLGYFNFPPPIAGQNLQVWYTDRLPVVYWDKYSYLAQLPGAPLAMYYLAPGRQIGFVIQSIEQVRQPADFFDTPEGYVVKDMNWRTEQIIMEKKQKTDPDKSGVTVPPASPVNKEPYRGG